MKIVQSISGTHASKRVELRHNITITTLSIHCFMKLIGTKSGPNARIECLHARHRQIENRIEQNITPSIIHHIVISSNQLTINNDQLMEAKDKRHTSVHETYIDYNFQKIHLSELTRIETIAIKCLLPIVYFVHV